MKEYFVVIQDGKVLMRCSGPEGSCQAQAKDGKTVVLISKDTARNFTFDNFKLDMVAAYPEKAEQLNEATDFDSLLAL